MQLNGVIQRKLALLDGHVSQLESFLNGVAREAFIGNALLRAATERLMQVSVEIVIDIAERIIAIREAGPVESSAAAIDRLVSLGAIQHVEPYRSMVGFRNRLVHEYEVIDPNILFTAATEHLKDFRRFRDEIDTLC